MKKLIQRWQTKRGKHWLELYKDELGFSYLSDDGGGSFGNATEEQARVCIQDIIACCKLDNINLYPVLLYPPNLAIGPGSPRL